MCVRGLILTSMTTTARITGPLRTWYDIHEALAFEVTAIAAAAERLAADDLPSIDSRFRMLQRELRTHSEVEDAMLFPEIERRGGTVAASFADEHHHEQQLVYDLECAVLAARLSATPAQLQAVALSAVDLRDRLVAHLRAEEDEVLTQVSDLFDDAEQASWLQQIFALVPADPDVQPWLTAALSPEHREARLRNMQQSLPRPALVEALRQIRAGVDASVWADICDRLPEMAALAGPST
jgi:hypothetical protein